MPEQEHSRPCLLAIDWDDEHAVQGLVQELVALKDTYNREIERQAEINIAWTCGRQLLFWNQANQRLVLQSNPNDRVRIVMNKMRPKIAAVIAKLGTLPAWLKSRRASSDISDYDAAITQTQVLMHYQRRLGFDQKTEGWDREVVVCAETFAKVWWDPQAGLEYGAFEPGDIGMKPEEFKKRYDKDKVEGLHEGDLRVDKLSLFNVFWGPVGAVFEEAEWAIEVYDRSKAYVQEHYGIQASKLKSAFQEEARVWRSGTGGSFGTRVDRADQDTVRVVVLWVRPHRTIPGLERGRYSVVVGHQVPINGPNPYDHQQIPLVRWGLFNVPTEGRAETFVTDLLPLQRDINQAASQATENRELLANPPTYVDEVAMVDEREWTNQIGGLRRYRGPNKPSMERVESNYRAAVAAIQTDNEAMEELAGIREASQGKNPPGVRSGAAVTLLQQADDERLGPIGRSRAKLLRQIGRLMLSVLYQFADEERVLRIGGDEFSSRTRLFSGKMLAPQGKRIGFDYFDTMLDPDAPPRTRGAIRQDLGVLLQHNFLRPDNPDHVRFVFQSLQIGYARFDQDREQAARELQHERNRLMAQGKYEPPRFWEDLETMLREMRVFQHDPCFTQLPESRQALFVQYNEEALAAMALRKPYQELVVQAALKRAGLLEQEAQQAGAAPAGGPPAAAAPVPLAAAG